MLIGKNGYYLDYQEREIEQEKACERSLEKN